MPRHAEWGPKPLRHETTQQAWRRRIYSWRSWRTGLNYTLLGALLLSFAFVPKASSFLIVFNAIQALLSVIFMPAENYADQDVVALMDDPAPTPQFPVKVTYKYEGLSLGEDEGVVTFHEGWLNFMGLRTHFSVREGDLAGVETPLEMTSRMLWITDERPILFCTFTPIPKAIVNGSKREGLVFKFIMSFDEWARNRAHPEGEPIFPVATLPPLERRGKQTPVTIALVLCSLALFATLGYTLHGSFLVMGLFLFLAIVMWLAIRSSGVKPAQRQAIENRLPLDVRLPWHEADLLDHLPHRRKSRNLSQKIFEARQIRRQDSDACPEAE